MLVIRSDRTTRADKLKPQRVQLLSTSDGIPVEFGFLPGAASDVRELNAFPLKLPASSEVYADSAYTDYLPKDTRKVTFEVTAHRNKVAVLQMEGDERR